MTDKAGENDKLLAAKIEDMIRLTQNGASYKCSFFLDERQKNIASQICSKCGAKYSFEGGYEQADRVQLCVFADYMTPAREHFDISPVTFTFRLEDRLTHRDFLGALMNLKITRESIGDILVSVGSAAVFLTGPAAALVLNEMKKVGAIGVETESGLVRSLDVKQDFAEVTGTVPSLRLDCIVSLALKVSRGDASNFIKAGAVSVDAAPCDNPAKLLKEGSTFSVRGKGKYRFENIGGKSRKDRLFITVKRYL